MTQTPVRTIAVFGNGLAGLLCAAKLVKVLPKHIKLTYIKATKDSETDIFFGTTTSPSTYDFLLGLDITEPDLVQRTNTAFSLGTRYQDWGPKARSWTQSFHRPLPLFNGVDFHHYLTRLKQSDTELSDIEPYIMAVQAADKGVFAHPPEGKNIPLKDIEYGYHFLPSDWRDLISAQLKDTSINWIKADIESVVRDNDTVRSIRLSNGQSLNPDFVIDGLGSDSKIRDKTGKFKSSNRTLRAQSSFSESEQPNGVCRLLAATEHGWQADTPLQNGSHRLTVTGIGSKNDASDALSLESELHCEVELGQLDNPWTGNCLTLGHGATVIEPLTPAPVMLLQRDIDRLAELIPVTNEMVVEAREYNRRFNTDYEYAGLFNDAFFARETLPKTHYWEDREKAHSSTKLSHKIEQFKSRGVLVQYDYEPFNAQDWAMQHFGMGRLPQRYDSLADHFPIDQLKQRLIQMKAAIEMMAKKMPPHPVYMAGLLKYLKDKHG